MPINVFASVQPSEPATAFASWMSSTRGKPKARGKKPRLTREVFRNKIVFIGSLATGLQEDERYTLGSSNHGGVEIVVTALDNILQGRYITDGSRFSFLFISLMVLGPSFQRWRRPRAMMTGALVLATLYLLANTVALFTLKLMWPVTGPFLGLTLSLMTFSLFYWDEERIRRIEIKALDAAKEELTAMAVHDLRNALAPVIVGLDLTKCKYDNSGVAESCLPMVRESSERLLCQINALLDIRQMVEGRLEAEAELDRRGHFSCQDPTGV